MTLWTRACLYDYQAIAAVAHSQTSLFCAQNASIILQYNAYALPIIPKIMPA